VSPRRIHLPLLALLLVLATAIGAPEAHAASYKSCSLSESDRDPAGAKPTYNLALKRKGVSCGTARKVMKAFHKCRARTSFTCTKTVLSHWRCTGRKDSSIPTLFYGSFTCTYGGRGVKSSYQQNT
jgi:hypothetical protein